MNKIDGGKFITINYFLSIVLVPLLSFVTGSVVSKKFSLDILQVISLFILFLFFVLYLFVVSRVLPNRVVMNKVLISEKKYVKAISCLEIFALFAFLVNIYRVYKSGISLFGANREYELIFGKYTLINYLYYLNGLFVSLFPISMYIIKKKNHKRKFKIYLIFSAIMLFFHGVKSTIIFPFLIAFYNDYIINKRLRIVLIVLIIIVIMVSFAFVNIYIRYGERDYFNSLMSLLLLYVTPSYSNLFLEMQHPSTYSMGSNTFGIFYKILGYFDSSIQMQNIHHYYVDINYNVGTIFMPAYNDYGYFGFIFYLSFITFYNVWAIKRYEREKTISTVFTLGLAGVQTLFIFWGNHFFKLQFIYWILITEIINVMVQNGTDRA